jgi:hypothetical protein
MASSLEATPRSNEDRDDVLAPNGPQQQQEPLASSSFHSIPSRRQSSVLKPSRIYYLDITFGLAILVHLLEVTLHAIVAIFGIGVGVGLILGDTVRTSVPTSRSSNSPSYASNGNSNATLSGHHHHHHQGIIRPQQSVPSMDSVILGGLPAQ